MSEILCEKAHLCVVCGSMALAPGHQQRGDATASGQCRKGFWVRCYQCTVADRLPVGSFVGPGWAGPESPPRGYQVFYDVL